MTLFQGYMTREVFCTSENRAFATVGPTPRARFVLFEVVGWVGEPSLRRWRVVRSLTTLASSPELSWY